MTHEAYVTSQIIDLVLKEAKGKGAKRVIEVRLAIGELTFLSIDNVRFWYETLTKDTIMEGSTLMIKEVEGLVKCVSCGYEGRLKPVSRDLEFHASPTLSCPNCGSSVDVISGRDCFIESIKFTV